MQNFLIKSGAAVIAYLPNPDAKRWSEDEARTKLAWSIEEIVLNGFVSADPHFGTEESKLSEEDAYSKSIAFFHDCELIEVDSVPENVPHIMHVEFNYFGNCFELPVVK
ncbi:hypothetical protein AAXE64_28040 [Priestia megaterium]